MMCYDCEPADVFESKIITARKPHRCTECRRTIPKGSRYERISALWDREWHNLNVCTLCHSVRRIIDRKIFPEGLCYSDNGELREYLSESVGNERVRNAMRIEEPTK